MEMTVIDLVGEFGLTPKRHAVRGARGDEYACPCPACGGTDRFVIFTGDNDGRGAYWCRDTGNGCGKSGDNIQFCIDFLGLDFLQACAKVGRAIEGRKAERSPVSRKPVARPAAAAAFTPRRYGHPADVDLAAWREKAGTLMERAHAKLMETPAQLAYLAGRGVPLAAVQRFRLGWVPERFWRPRESWGLPTIKKDDGKPKKLYVPRGILIPYFVDGDLVRIRIRTPKEDRQGGFPPPYYILPGSDPGPMLIDAERRAFVVTEAELDGMAVASAAGDLVGVCAMGNTSVDPDERMHRRLEQAVCILNAMDADGAGMKRCQWWQTAYPSAQLWPVPAGKDPGEAFEAGEELRLWVVSGLPPSMTMDLCALDSQMKGGGDVEHDGGERGGADADPCGVLSDEHGAQPKAQPEVDASAADGVADLAPTVAELAGLLKRYPVRIINRPDRTGIEEKDIMRKFPAESKRISALLYFDPACWEHVATHPAEVIIGENFLDG